MKVVIIPPFARRLGEQRIDGIDGSVGVFVDDTSRLRRPCAGAALAEDGTAVTHPSSN